MLRHLCGRIFVWENFYRFLWQELKVFFYFLFIFCLFRILFIVWMHDYIGNGVAAGDVAAALFCGLRLSLKSAGILTLFSATLGLFFYVFQPRFGEAARRAVSAFYLVVLTVLFCGRIPYYAQFHSGYNQLIFNTFNDDVYALWISLVAQFQLPLRLVGAVALAAVLYVLLTRFLRCKLPQLPSFSHWSANWLLRLLFLAALYHAALFVNFGGSMSYVGNVDWENAGITKDQLLNEAILDDMQALYRAYEMNGRLESSTGLSFQPEEIRNYAALLTGKAPMGNDLDEYLKKSAIGAPHQPKQIFLILSESYANWPLLERYADLHLADGMKRVIERPDSVYVDAFLPNGMSTISAVMGIVTGFADANLYLTTMPEAYEAPYSTALAPQMRKLGYITRFWYAGPSSWERVRDFSLAQGFEEFYGSGDYAGAAGNVWGCDDEFLYRAALDGIAPDAPSFNLVLNVSNHSPFTVDVAGAGFDGAALRAALPEAVRDDEALIRQLGHFWYADQVLSAFVAAAREKYPDSLFIIVGDHADRINVDKSPSMYERYGVPLIITGTGVTKRSLPEGALGSHIDVMPTLIELIAPRDFTYYSVGTSLTRGNRFGANYGFWMADGYIGRTDAPFASEVIKPDRPLPDAEIVRQYVEAVRSISWWRSKYGKTLAE